MAFQGPKVIGSSKAAKNQLKHKKNVIIELGEILKVIYAVYLLYLGIKMSFRDIYSSAYSYMVSEGRSQTWTWVPQISGQWPFIFQENYFHRVFTEVCHYHYTIPLYV